MAKSRPETIVLRGDYDIKEAQAGGAITPGHLIKRSSATAVVVHAAAAGAAQKLFAIENDIAGDDITVNYASGSVVRFVNAKPGDEIYAILADGQNVAAGDFLVSNGNGELQKVTVAATTLDTAVIAVALEAIDASDSATTAVASRRIKVEIL